MHSLQMGIKEQRKYAEQMVKTHEQGNVRINFIPQWLGEEGFEDLTARWLASCDKKSNTETWHQFSPPASPTPSETSDQEFEPYEGFSATPSSPTPSEASDQDQERYDQFSRTSSPTHSHSEKESQYHSKSESDSDLEGCSALQAIQRSMYGKAYATQQRPFIPTNVEEICLELNDPNTEDDSYVAEEVEQDDLCAEAYEIYEEKARQKQIERRLEASKCYLLAALESYERERESGTRSERNGEVVEALEKVVRLEKGKEPIEWELEEPRVDLKTWKEIVDLVIWEVEDYCWVVRDEDVDVDAEVLDCVKRMLERCKGIDATGSN